MSKEIQVTKEEYITSVKDSMKELLAGGVSAVLDTQVGGSHYSDMKIQPVEFITANSIPYLEGNVIKYTCRHSVKNGAEDIDKAIQYLKMIREFTYEANMEE